MKIDIQQSEGLIYRVYIDNQLKYRVIKCSNHYAIYTPNFKIITNIKPNETLLENKIKELEGVKV